MKKKIIIIALSIFFLYLLYNAVFEYILITIYNEDTDKYDGSHVVAFSHFPFVIVNPFKKQILLDKIYKYCISEKFNIYYNCNYKKNDYSKCYFCYQKSAIEKILVIKALKNENSNLLILATERNNSEAEIVFILDKKNDEIIGYF